MTEYWRPSHWSETEKLPGFCESELPLPYEIANTITSLFLVFWGIYGLYQLPSPLYQISSMWQIVYSLLICVGIGTIGFHWSLDVGWGLMDALPMVLFYIQIYYIALFHLIPLVLRVKLINEPDSSHKCFHFISKLFGVFILFFALLSIVITSLYGQHCNAFFIIFALIPILTFIAFIWLYLDPSLLKNKIKDSEEYKLIFRHLWTGFSVVAISSMIWIASEQFCHTVSWIKYFPGHGLWHFGMSYGMYNLIQVLIFIDFDIGNLQSQNNLKVKIMKKQDGKNKLQGLWYSFVPVLFIYESTDDEYQEESQEELLNI